MPKGVDKGSAFLHTVGGLALPPDTITVAAGDGTGDCSLFAVVDKAIMPANAEPNLIAWTEQQNTPDKYYLASKPFAAGVHQGMQHFGLLPS